MFDQKLHDEAVQLRIEGWNEKDAKKLVRAAGLFSENENLRAVYVCSIAIEKLNKENGHVYQNLEG